MADENVRIRIDGNADALKAALDGAGSAVRAMTDNVAGSFNALNGVFAKFNGVLALVTAALAGGHVFKAAVDETVRLTAESNKLARTFGISTQQAGALRMAIDDLSASQPGLEISTQAMDQAAGALAKRLGSNEQAFRAMGIQVRDTATGGFRPMLDIMFDTNEKLLNMKEGADRNVAANVLYGRSWRDIQGILGLTREKMEAAREKAERLNLMIGPEGAAQVAQYRSALNDVNDSITAMQVNMGNALLPALTDLAQGFADAAPAFEVFNNMLKGHIIVVRTLIFTFMALFEIINAVVETIYNSLAAAMEVIGRLLTGDLKGAWKAFDDRANATKYAWRSAMVDISVSAGETAAKIEKILEPRSAPVKPAGASKGAPNPGGSSDTYTDPKEMQARAMAAIETRKALAIEAVEVEAERVRNMAELHEIEQRDAIAKLKELENKKLAIEIEALRAQKTALEKYGANASEIDKVNGQIQEAQAKHKTAMVKIDHQMTKEILKDWYSMVDAMEGAFTSTIQKMARGQATIRDLFRNVWNSLLDEFIKIQAHLLFTHVKGEMAKTAATAEGETSRNAIQAAGAEQGLMVSMGMKAKEIIMAGWAAAASTYASIAAIPIVGPFLAPAAAIAAAAAVHKMVSNLASAAGGWDNVPRDQLAMVHKNEMILPAPLAERVRGMTGTGNGIVINNNFNSVYHNRADIKRFMTDNSGAVAAGLRRAFRDFNGK